MERWSAAHGDLGGSVPIRHHFADIGTDGAPRFTHQSTIKTTFLLYLAWPFGMMAACDEMGAVTITGRWKPSA